MSDRLVNFKKVEKTNPPMDEKWLEKLLKRQKKKAKKVREEAGGLTAKLLGDVED